MVIINSNSTDVLKLQCTHTQAHARRRAVVIGTVSSADVNSARQMQGFNSGTTAWFAWAAACLSVIRTCSNSQHSGSWNSLLTRERRHARVSEKECECSLCAAAWFIRKAVLHHDNAATALSRCNTRQNKTLLLVQSQNSLKWIF